MKTITVKQPWASLIALGDKKLETRSWATKYRGPIAIHAGKTVDKKAFQYELIRQALSEHGITDWRELPTGAVIATGNLAKVWRVENDSRCVMLYDVITKKFRLWHGGMPDEYHFGDYSDGRFAWQLDDVVPLQQPIPANGQLSLWNWEPPTE